MINELFRLFGITEFTLRGVLSAVSGVVFLYAFKPYIGEIVRKESQPRKATWIIWAVGDWIVLAGQFVQHKINGLMVGAVIGATITLVVSMLYGEPGWKKEEKWSMGSAGIALVLWLVFGESDLGIAFGSLALLIASWPTWVSAWENPKNESLWGWIWFNVSSFIACLAIPHWTFADVVPPVVFMIIDVVTLYVVWLHPRLLKARVQTKK